jgi:hypothetical protein
MAKEYLKRMKYQAHGTRVAKATNSVRPEVLCGGLPPKNSWARKNGAAREKAGSEKKQKLWPSEIILVPVRLTSAGSRRYRNSPISRTVAETPLTAGSSRRRMPGSTVPSRQSRGVNA